MRKCVVVIVVVVDGSSRRLDGNRRAGNSHANCPRSNQIKELRATSGALAQQLTTRKNARARARETNVVTVDERARLNAKLTGAIVDRAE